MVESGLVAAATNATFAVVSGGIGCLAVVGVVAAKLPGLPRYETTPEPLRNVTITPLASPEPVPVTEVGPTDAAGG